MIVMNREKEEVTYYLYIFYRKRVVCRRTKSNKLKKEMQGISSFFAGPLTLQQTLQFWLAHGV